MYHALPCTTYHPKKKYHTPPLFFSVFAAQKMPACPFCTTLLSTFSFFFIAVAVANSPCFCLPILFFPPIASSRTVTTTIKHKMYPLPHTSSNTHKWRTSLLCLSVCVCMLHVHVASLLLFSWSLFFFLILFCLTSDGQTGRHTPFVAIYHFAQWIDCKENHRLSFCPFFSSTAKPILTTLHRLTLSISHPIPPYPMPCRRRQGGFCYGFPQPFSIHVLSFCRLYAVTSFLFHLQTTTNVADMQKQTKPSRKENSSRFTPACTHPAHLLPPTLAHPTPPPQ
ncbi:MAG: hypothetical protein JOS17DRAFT_401830 [Linnemannia elongata]|nr:MAG: hypothetical protein JOS17DRAFT_401830 [Linnemannia elongata]